MNANPERPTSRLLKILSENLQSLVGPGSRFQSVREISELPRRDPVGVKPIYRALRAEQEPTLAQLERISEATGIAAPLLLCEGMNAGQMVSNSRIRPEIARLIAKLTDIDNLKPLTDFELQHIDNSLQLLSRDKPERIAVVKNNVM